MATRARRGCSVNCPDVTAEQKTEEAVLSGRPSRAKEFGSTTVGHGSATICMGAKPPAAVAYDLVELVVTAVPDSPGLRCLRSGHLLSEVTPHTAPISTLPLVGRRRAMSSYNGSCRPSSSPHERRLGEPDRALLPLSRGRRVNDGRWLLRGGAQWNVRL
jgi:hypothetical protein